MCRYVRLVSVGGHGWLLVYLLWLIPKRQVPAL